MKSALAAHTASYFKAFAAALPVNDVVVAGMRAYSKDPTNVQAIKDAASDAVWAFQKSDKGQQIAKDYADRLYDAKVVAYNIGGQQGMREVRSRAKKDGSTSFDLVNTDVLARLQSDSLTSATLQLGATSRADLRDTLASGLANGSGIDVLASDLRSKMSDWSTDRARTVATTEVTSAMSQASSDLYANNGVAENEWSTAGGELVCELCQGNEDDGPVPVGEAFSSGDTEPGAHPDCECTLLPVIPDDWNPGFSGEGDMLDADGNVMGADEPWMGENVDPGDQPISGCFVGKSFKPKAGGAEDDCAFDDAWASEKMSQLKRAQAFDRNVPAIEESGVQTMGWAQANGAIESWANAVTEEAAMGLRVAAADMFGTDISAEYGLARTAAATERELALTKSIYADTQSYLRAQGMASDETITLYRGIRGDMADEIKAHGEDKVLASQNVLSSYTLDRSLAEKFAEGHLPGFDTPGIVIETQVPVSDIFAVVSNYLPEWGKETEYIVISRGPREVSMSASTAKSKTRHSVGSVDSAEYNLEWNHTAVSRGYVSRAKK